MNDNDNGKRSMQEIRTEMQVDNSLAIVQQPELTPAKWQMIVQIAERVYKSRIFQGISSPDAAAVVMLKGLELGMGITASFEFIRPILGKFELIPRGALALLHQHPNIKKIEVNRLASEKGDFIGYECSIKRVDGFEHTARFTMDDAQRAGLVKPDSGYMKWPENMCMWRAIGFAADVAAPDITSGMTAIMKAPERYGVEIDSAGNVIDVQAVETGVVETGTENAQESYTGTADNSLTLNELIEAHGPEKVMLAIQEKLGGRMPATGEEMSQLLEALG